MLVSAAAAPVALIGGWTLAQARQSGGFSGVGDTISALAAEGADDPWILTAGLFVLGACHLATAAGLNEAAPAGRILLALGGAATVATTVMLVLLAWLGLELRVGNALGLSERVLAGLQSLWPLIVAAGVVRSRHVLRSHDLKGVNSHVPGSRH